MRRLYNCGWQLIPIGGDDVGDEGNKDLLKISIYFDIILIFFLLVEKSIDC